MAKLQIKLKRSLEGIFNAYERCAAGAPFSLMLSHKENLVDDEG